MTPIQESKDVRLKKIYRLHFYEKLSFREIEKLLNIPSSTLNDYSRRIKDLGLTEEEFLGIGDEGLHGLIFPCKSGERNSVDKSYSSFDLRCIILNYLFVCLLLAAVCLSIFFADINNQPNWEDKPPKNDGNNSHYTQKKIS